MEHIERRNSTVKVVFYLLFAGYAVIAVNLILFKTIPITAIFSYPGLLRSVNLMPFYTIISYFSDDSVGLKRLLENILGNIALFIPLGVFVSHMGVMRSSRYKFGIILTTTVSFEIIQYILALGSSDIDDVLLNLIGGMLGIAVYKSLERRTTSREQIMNALVVFFLVTGISGIAVIGTVDRNLLPFGHQKFEYIDENKGIMAGLDESTADLFGDLNAAEQRTITVYQNPKYMTTLSTADTEKAASELYNDISLNAATKVFIRHISSEKNQLISRYEEGSTGDLASLLKQKGTDPTVRIWLSDDDVQVARAVLVSVTD
ncbi:VanZ family protein [Paenibacillus sp. GCM10012306]|uniref:VanZ family protein n=1 Tax=Paenibacillus sp. GCM10012306 TaxID=3317342 RepID=UPI0036088DA8